jgi:hypothetical protein
VTRELRPERKDILFLLGIIGIALEEARAFGEPSETLLLLFAAMIGLPLVLRADEARKSSEDMKSGQTSSVGETGNGEP